MQLAVRIDKRPGESHMVLDVKKASLLIPFADRVMPSFALAAA